VELIAWGGRYEGTYDNDKRHGFGTFTWASGDRCVRLAGAGCLACLGAARMHSVRGRGALAACGRT